MLEHRCAPGEQPETLLASLADLFDQIASSRKKFGILHPRKFVNKVKKENGVWVVWRRGREGERREEGEGERREGKTERKGERVGTLDRVLTTFISHIEIFDFIC